MVSIYSKYWDFNVDIQIFIIDMLGGTVAENHVGIRHEFHFDISENNK